MNYAQIRKMDISDGPYIRVGFYVQGCTHHCKGCYNQETWDFDGGKEWSEETNEKIIEFMKPDYIKGLSLLGGDPICVHERDPEILLSLVKRVKELYPDKTIWLWTGYLFEDIVNLSLNEETPLQVKVYPLLKYIDVIVDGRYIERYKERLPYAGSSNQRAIKVKETLDSRQIVIYKGL